MNRLIYLSFLGAVLVIGSASRARANEVDLTFTGVNGANQGGFYVSPYYATIDGKKGVSIYCDDFLHEIRFGQSWDATVSTFSDLSHARFQGSSPSDTLQHYGEVAWLVEQLSISPKSEWGDINFALWRVMDPAVHTGSGFTANAGAFFHAAQTRSYTAAEFSGWEILTPVVGGPGSPQEMLTPRATPEPASLVLFGTGMLALGSYVRKLNK